MNYLGIDWGYKKIGLATGSSETRIASPFGILEVKNFNQAIAKLEKIIKENDIDFLVIGKPLELSGAEKDNQLYDNFIDKIKSLGVKMDFIDERMSTKLANVLQKDFGRQDGRDDDLAAAAILQTYLDKQGKG